MKDGASHTRRGPDRLRGLLLTLRSRPRLLWGVIVSGAGCLAVIAACIALLPGRLPPPDAALAVGKRAPPFLLRDQVGSERTLDEFRGMRVVLVFFPGHWCADSIAELEALQANHGKFTSRKAEVVAISSSSVEEHRALMNRIGAVFPILSDPEGSVIREYGLAQRGGRVARPAVLILDRDGTVKEQFLTEDVRVRPRPETLLAALERR